MLKASIWVLSLFDDWSICSRGCTRGGLVLYSAKTAKRTHDWVREISFPLAARSRFRYSELGLCSLLRCQIALDILICIRFDLFDKRGITPLAKFLESKKIFYFIKSHSPEWSEEIYFISLARNDVNINNFRKTAMFAISMSNKYVAKVINISTMSTPRYYQYVFNQSFQKTGIEWMSNDYKNSRCSLNDLEIFGCSKKGGHRHDMVVEKGDKNIFFSVKCGQKVSVKAIFRKWKGGHRHDVIVEKGGKRIAFSVKCGREIYVKAILKRWHKIFGVDKNNLEANFLIQKSSNTCVMHSVHVCGDLHLVLTSES